MTADLVRRLQDVIADINNINVESHRAVFNNPNLSFDAVRQREEVLESARHHIRIAIGWLRKVGRTP